MLRSIDVEDLIFKEPKEIVKNELERIQAQLTQSQIASITKRSDSSNFTKLLNEVAKISRVYDIRNSIQNSGLKSIKIKQLCDQIASDPNARKYCGAELLRPHKKLAVSLSSLPPLFSRDNNQTVQLNELAFEGQPSTATFTYCFKIINSNLLSKFSSRKPSAKAIQTTQVVTTDIHANIPLFYYLSRLFQNSSEHGVKLGPSLENPLQQQQQQHASSIAQPHTNTYSFISIGGNIYVDQHQITQNDIPPFNNFLQLHQSTSHAVQTLIESLSTSNKRKRETTANNDMNTTITPAREWPSCQFPLQLGSSLQYWKFTQRNTSTSNASTSNASTSNASSNSFDCTVSINSVITEAVLHNLILSNVRSYHPFYDDNSIIIDISHRPQPNQTIHSRSHGPRAGKCKHFMCEACRLHTSVYTVYEDRLTPKSPVYLCRMCFQSLHYSADGELLYTALVYSTHDD